VSRSQKRVIVADLKAGYLDQGDTETHDQTAIYAAAAAEMFDADEVLVYLIQPRAEKQHRVPRPALYDAQALRAVRAQTAAAIALNRRHNPPLNPGYEQCLYCRALTACPSAWDFTMNALEAFQIIGAPKTEREWGELVGASKLAEKIADNVKAAAKERLAGGQGVYGFKLGNGRSMRYISDTATALQKLAANGFTQEMLANCDSLSLRLGALPPPALDVLADYIKEKTSEPSLIADKRSKE
jgi:hypothetical protein